MRCRRMSSWRRRIVLSCSISRPPTDGTAAGANGPQLLRADAAQRSMSSRPRSEQIRACAVDTMTSVDDHHRAPQALLIIQRAGPITQAVGDVRGNGFRSPAACARDARFALERPPALARRRPDHRGHPMLALLQHRVFSGSRTSIGPDRAGDCQRIISTACLGEPAPGKRLVHPRPSVQSVGGVDAVPPRLSTSPSSAASGGR